VIIIAAYACIVYDFHEVTLKLQTVMLFITLV